MAPGLALVMVTVKKVCRLQIAVLAPDAVLAPVLAPASVHDPMHNSDLIHVISCYLHSFIVFVVAFLITLLYNAVVA